MVEDNNFEEILEKLYESKKHKPRGYSCRLYSDLSDWVNKEYSCFLKRGFDFKKLETLTQNLDSKLPPKFNYGSLVDGTKKEIIELKKRHYTDNQVSVLTAIIGNKELLNLERKIKKPKKTIIGLAITRYSKPLTTKSKFISTVDRYFRNYTEIVNFFGSERKTIAKSVAIMSFRRDSFDQALKNATKLYENYTSIYNKYKQVDENIAKSIAIRAFFRTNFMDIAERFYQNFRKIYEIYSTNDPQLAESIAHWTFMAQNPEKQAKKLYDKLKEAKI